MNKLLQKSEVILLDKEEKTIIYKMQCFCGEIFYALSHKPTYSCSKCRKYKLSPKREQEIEELYDTINKICDEREEINNGG